jgi:putative transposase
MQVSHAPHRSITLDFSRPGKPTDNAFIESFNGKFRTECLNAHRFMSLVDARERMEDWCKTTMRTAPHVATGGREFKSRRSDQ